MLTGKKINLRLLRKKELLEYIELFNRLEHRGEFFPPILLTEARLGERLDKDGFWSDESMLLVIAAKDSDQILGQLVAFKATAYYNGYEFGYLLFDPDARGGGYTSEAVELFSDYLFKSKPICRLQLQIEAENKPSVRVAEKCGFTFEGTARSAYFRGGKPVDIGMYSLTLLDWQGRKGLL